MSVLIWRLPMVMWLLLLLLRTVIGFWPEADALIPPTDSQLPSCSDSNSLACDLEEAKLKIVRLESILETRIEEINSKIQYFGDLEKKVEGLNSRIDNLKTVISGFENDQSMTSRKIVALEEEIKLLWAASRKNNFEVYSLESKAEDAEKRLKEVNSKVEEVSEIVTEQWIQIQKLEQAVYMAEVRTLKAKMEYWRKCPFVKLVIDLYTECLRVVKETQDSVGAKYKSLTAWCKVQVSPAFAAAKHYHHQLQKFIWRAMQSNEMTAALAHEEVVFFMASAVVAFPIMTACMALVSQFGKIIIH